MNKMDYPWQDLSDDEIRQRLEQRGMSPRGAEYMARRRDNPGMAKAIDDLAGFAGEQSR